jgi:hypothetical protein
MRLRDVLGISERRQTQITWFLELFMLGVFIVGLVTGEPKIIINAAGALLIVQIVPVLERNYNVPMDAGITLWITGAVFLHALGTIGLPGGLSFYRTVPWWDDMTHALSASVVAGLGYAMVRGIDEHSESVELPSKFVFVFILMFILCIGVLWEVLEFALGIGAAMLGTDTVLTQYGLHDTLTDLLFNSLGAVIVAIWGTAHLQDLSSYIRERLDARSA